MFERTRIPHVQSDLVSDASRLLDLGGLAVDRVASDAFGGRVVHVVTADETASACPSCGVLSVTLKGRVCTRPRDIPYGTRVLRLIWHKRRWRCKERLCPRASFTESLPAVRARSRLTTRLRTELGYAIAEQGRVVSESAAHYGVDWSIVHNAFVEHVRIPLSAPLPPVKVLGIDETRRGRPVFAQDPDTHRWVLVCDRWHTGFVDAAGTGGLLAQVEGRTSAATIAWLNAQPASWRAGISHVTIDLSASYAKAAREALPDAVLVADRYPPGPVSRRHVHTGPSTGHPRNRRQTRPQDRPGLDGAAPAADRTRAVPARNLCEDVELADRHRSGKSRAPKLRLRPSGDPQ